MKLRHTFGLITLGLVACAACSAASSDDGGNGGALAPVDGDGDGIADTLGKTIDANLDGIPDQVDLNGDGILDGIAVDTNNDGIADGVGVDTNGDGILNGLDIDGDGIADTIAANPAPIAPPTDGLIIEMPVVTPEEDGELSCAAAALNATYIGCEFYPTVTYNPLYSEFEFAVVLANGGATPATITVSGGALTADLTETVPAGGLKAIRLPWQADLKGPEFARSNTSNGRPDSSVLVEKGAYRLVSSEPVTAWQFNPLQYKKPKSELPGGCGTAAPSDTDCFSASNDASLLIPAAAMTGNYRVMTRAGINGGRPGGAFTSAPSGVTITGTADNTTVTLEYAESCEAYAGFDKEGDCVAAGTGVSAAKGGEQQTYTLNRGDVLQLLGVKASEDGRLNSDLSGTVINATQPVQVIGFNPITNIPDVSNADHIEETILPAEVLGKEYLVAPPTSPSGAVKGGHVVRFYGNFDGTTLTYEGSVGGPTTLEAGDVVEIETDASFKVTGSQPFAVGSFMLGGASQGSGSCPNFPCYGDPAFSMSVTPEQFRTDYTFLAPIDYYSNFVDILIPDSATSVLLDGVAVTATETVAAGWKIARVELQSENFAGTGDGSHKVVSDQPVGLQVMGFGHATSYYYPGGLNLEVISEPPVIDIIK